MAAAADPTLAPFAAAVSSPSKTQSGATLRSVSPGWDRRGTWNATLYRNSAVRNAMGVRSQPVAGLSPAVVCAGGGAQLPGDVAHVKLGCAATQMSSHGGWSPAAVPNPFGPAGQARPRAPALK